MKPKLIIEFEEEIRALDKAMILASFATHFENEVKPTLKLELEMSDIYFERIPEILTRG